MSKLAKVSVLFALAVGFASAQDPDEPTYEECDPFPFPAYWVGDGFCDGNTPLNSAACGWDGGDCCEETCVPNPFTCGMTGYNCQDPAFAGESLLAAAGGVSAEVNETVLALKKMAALKKLALEKMKVDN